MAKIKWSAIGITNASGKSGGSVFSHNRAGSYVRRWAKPVNRQSDRQTAMRSLWGNVSQQWGRLTDEQVNLWNSAAQNTTVTDGFGDTRNMTGFSLFMRTNQNRTHGMGKEITQIPLPMEVLPAVNILSVGPTLDGSAESASAISISMEDGSPETTFTASIGFSLVAPNKNVGFGSVKNKFNFRMRKQFTTDAAGNATVLVSNAEIAEIIGAPFDNTTLFVQVHTHSDAGQKSNPVTGQGRIVNPSEDVQLTQYPEGPHSAGDTILIEMKKGSLVVPGSELILVNDDGAVASTTDDDESKAIHLNNPLAPATYTLQFSTPFGTKFIDIVVED